MRLLIDAHLPKRLARLLQQLLVKVLLILPYDSDFLIFKISRSNLY